MLELTCDQAQTLKEFTENHYAQASFFWEQLLKEKNIKVNGVRVKENVPLNVGDTIAYYLTQKQAEKSAFFTVYQDENVLIVDKESGVNSEAVFSELERQGDYRFIHRLDRNTKGLLVFARNEFAETALLKAFREKTVKKMYHALCFGKIPVEHAVLKAFLRKDAKNALSVVFDHPTSGAVEIVTEYLVLEYLQEQITKVEIVLHTGKTHQIRAHFAHVGFPIVGDMKYGDKTQNRALKTARQCLVAKILQFSLEGELEYLNEKTFVSRFEAELPTK